MKLLSPGYYCYIPFQIDAASQMGRTEVKTSKVQGPHYKSNEMQAFQLM
jgi:hypothetical protein